MTPREIKEFRRKKNFSQAELAAELGVSIHAVQSWEQGKNPVPAAVEKLLMFQVELGLPVEFVTALSEKARELGITFEEAFYSALRAGIPHVENPRPKSASNAQAEKPVPPKKKGKPDE